MENPQFSLVFEYDESKTEIGGILMQSLFVKNRAKLAERLQAGDAVILFQGSAPRSTADSHYSFRPDKNFFYFTGLNQENFKVILFKMEDGTLQTTLFIEKPDYDVEKWHGRKLKKDKAIEISGIETVHYLEDFEGFVNRLANSGHLKCAYFDLQKLSYDEVDHYAHQQAAVFAKRIPFVTVASIHPIVSELRMVKDAMEIEQMKKAVELTKVGLEAIMKSLKPGFMEYQIESTFAHTIRMNGADGNSFPTIAASGADAVILHYVENNKATSEGELVLIDLGAQYQQYAADISRTYPVSGVFTDRQKQLYNIVLKAEETVIKSMKPGIHFTELNDLCKKVLCEELKAIGLIENDDELFKYYYHGVSHHLGLDVHDLGGRDITLKPGMVFTVEPGLYIAEEGIGIRIEDDVLITETGYEVLSKDIIKSVEDIEAFMKA